MTKPSAARLADALRNLVVAVELADVDPVFIAKELKAAKTALRATPPTPAPDEAAVRAEWQPIETAPKDREVIIYIPSSADASLGSYVILATCEPSATGGEMMWWPKDGNGWLEFNEPSHWCNPPGYRAALLGERT